MPDRYSRGRGTEVLPALYGSSPSERHGGNTCKRHGQAVEPELHRPNSSPYQPLTLFSGFTLVLLAVLVSSPDDTKTDQTLGRSVALVARRHPKCPFQVARLRVRAFRNVPVVLKY
jgi:hypothetical protein